MRKTVITGRDRGENMMELAAEANIQESVCKNRRKNHSAKLK